MITIINKPQKFTPVGNPVIFQIESDNPDILFFKVQVIEVTSDFPFFTGEFEVRPDYQNGSILYLNKILGNEVNWQVNNSLNILVAPMDKPILNYKLIISEWLSGDNGVATQSLESALETDSFYVWEAEMNIFFFDTYNQQDYLITSGLPAKFLSNKPDFSTINDDSTEQLYFLQESEDDLRLIINTYDSNNSQLRSTSTKITDLDKYKMFRLNIAPKALVETLAIDFDNVKYYKVYLQDEDGKIKTETRTYLYESVPCYVEPTNILWINSMGGLDSYQLVNVVATTNLTRNTVQKNTYKMDNGIYSNRTGEMLNPFVSTINVSKSGSYVGYSKFVSDDEAEWLNELFISKQVFVELADESLIPVSVTNNSYLVQKTSQTKSFNTISVTYTINGDIIPAKKLQIEQGFGSGQSQIDFINSQMNDGFDTVLTFSTDVIAGSNGVGGSVGNVDDNLQFEFNKISQLYGLPNSMIINVGGIAELIVDFTGDYLNKNFRFTSKNGTAFTGSFINGNKNF